MGSSSEEVRTLSRFFMLTPERVMREGERERERERDREREREENETRKTCMRPSTEQKTVSIFGAPS